MIPGMYRPRCHRCWPVYVYHPGPEEEGTEVKVKYLFYRMYISVSDTDHDEHAQFTLASIFSVNVKLSGKCGRDTASQPRAAGSHFAGIVSGQNPKPEETERSETISTDSDSQGTTA